MYSRPPEPYHAALLVCSVGLSAVGKLTSCLPVTRQVPGGLVRLLMHCSSSWRAGAEDITKCMLTPMMSGTGFQKLCHGLQDFPRKLPV
jgi:hypothetical protein